MHESLQLFGSLVNDAALSHASLAVFYNKKDLFSAKLRTVPLTVCFPEYAGSTEADAEAYIVEQFEKKLNSAPQRGVYRYTTCATDTGQIGVVWRALMDVYYRAAMSKAGF